MVTFRPKLEQLERRDTPTTAFVSGSVLFVQGTAGNDDILVTQNGDGTLSVSGVAGTFTAGSISVSGYDGDDRIEIDLSVTKKSRLYGLGGNDTLIGSNQNDLIYGGDGDDAMHGRGGADGLSGGVGTDYFDGGTGFDTATDVDGDSRTLVDIEQLYLI